MISLRITQQQSLNSRKELKQQRIEKIEEKIKNVCGLGFFQTRRDSNLSQLNKLHHTKVVKQDEVLRFNQKYGVDFDQLDVKQKKAFAAKNSPIKPPNNQFIPQCTSHRSNNPIIRLQWDEFQIFEPTSSSRVQTAKNVTNNVSPQIQSFQASKQKDDPELKKQIGNYLIKGSYKDFGRQGSKSMSNKHNLILQSQRQLENFIQNQVHNQEVNNDSQNRKKNENLIISQPSQSIECEQVFSQRSILRTGNSQRSLSRVKFSQYSITIDENGSRQQEKTLKKGVIKELSKRSSYQT